MDLKFISDGRRLHLHPDCRELVLEIPAFQLHSGFHTLCRQVYNMNISEAPPADSDLASQGFELVPEMLSTEYAAQVSEEITTVLSARGPDGGAFAPVNSDTDCVNIMIPDEPSIRKVLLESLQRIMTPQTEALLEAYYGCYFRVDQARAFRTHMATENTVSFLWHRDLAPLAQVHIMVYLTDSGLESGSTQFLNFAQTKAAARLGYHYTEADERKRSLDELCSDAGEDLTGHYPEPRTGDALIFAASRILHRGSVPKRGFRDAFLLVLQPSFVPWRQDLEEFGDSHLLIPEMKDTLGSNPYEPLMPEKPGADGRHNVSWEPWIIDGELLPEA